MSPLLRILCAASLVAAVGCSAAKPPRPDSLAARDKFRKDEPKTSLFGRLKPERDESHLPVWDDRPVSDEASLKVAYADYMAGSGNAAAARKAYADALKLNPDHAAA